MKNFIKENVKISKKDSYEILSNFFMILLAYLIL